MSDVIKFCDVSWRRSGEAILSSINWTVKQGEHWGVLGLNGSGKTTLLNMVNGYIWPTTGEVSVLGKQFGQYDLRQLRRSIGWVSSAFEYRINGRQRAEYLVVSGKYAQSALYTEPSAEDEARALEIMQVTGCLHLKGRLYDTCSEGEKQKILIARALMADPELLILDEPTNGLDFIAREELLDMIRQLMTQDGAQTLILITHHLEELVPEFTHVLLLQDGRVFDQGKRDVVLNEETLSQFFNRSVSVEWRRDRAWLSLT